MTLIHIYLRKLLKLFVDFSEPEIIAIEIKESTKIKENITSPEEKSADSCKESFIEKPAKNDVASENPAKNSTDLENPAKTSTDSEISAKNNKDSASDSKSADEQESTRPRSSRYGLRENRGLKYHGFREDLLFKEQMLKVCR